MDSVAEVLQRDRIKDGDAVVGWIAVVEVLGADGQRYLATRIGEGAGDTPSPWTTVGMLRIALMMEERDVVVANGGYPEPPS